MKRKYELTLILPDSATEKTAAKLLEDTLQKSGGSIAKKDSWGKKDLAYPIKKKPSGFYAFFEVDLEPNQAADLQNRLKLNEEVLRYLLVK